MVVGVALALGPAAGAEGPATSPPCQADSFVRALPAGCDAVVVVTDAARQRRSPGGSGLRAMLTESRAFPETTRAWRDLAASLDWSGDRAFDELLGRRVAVVARNIGSGGPTKWAVLMLVSAEAERRMRERLRAAPRGSIGGLPVLAVEDGQYELVVGRPQPGVDPQLVNGAASGSLVLLAPSRDTSLFADLVPSLLSRTGLAGPAPAWAPGKRECDLVVVLRQAGGAGDARGFLCVTAMQEGAGWESRLVCTPELIWDAPGGVPAIEPWADGAFASLERDALIAVMGLRGASHLRAAGFIPGLTELVQAMPLTFGQHAGQLAGLFVRPIRETVDLASRPVRPAGTGVGDALASGGRSTRALPSKSPRGDAAERLSVTVAARAPDSRTVAAEGDLAVARFIGVLESGQCEHFDPPPVVHREGPVSEQAIRTLTLDGSFPIHTSYAQTLERSFGPEPVLAWGATRPSPAMAHTRAHEVSKPEPSPGWWVATLSPEGGSAVARDAAVLGGPQTGAERPRLSVGVVRPAAIGRLLGSADPGFFGALGIAQRIESFRWDLWVREDGAVEGTASIRLIPE